MRYGCQGLCENAPGSPRAIAFSGLWHLAIQCLCTGPGQIRRSVHCGCCLWWSSDSLGVRARCSPWLLPSCYERTHSSWTDFWYQAFCVWSNLNSPSISPDLAHLPSSRLLQMAQYQVHSMPTIISNAQRINFQHFSTWTSNSPASRCCPWWDLLRLHWCSCRQASSLVPCWIVGQGPFSFAVWSSTTLPLYQRIENWSQL